MSDINPYQPPANPVEDVPITRDGSEPYVSAAGLARGTVIALGLAMLADLGAVGSGVLQFSVLAKIAAGAHTEAEVQFSDALYRGCGIFQILTMVATAVVFCMWFQRSYRNLRAFGVITAFTPGWAAGSFFVPFLNLARPYQIAKEIWGRSAPLESDTGPVGWWWALFLGSSFMSNIGARMSMAVSTADSLQTATVVTLIADVLSIGAAILAIRMVRGIEKRQSAQAGELTAAPAALPG